MKTSPSTVTQARPARLAAALRRSVVKDVLVARWDRERNLRLRDFGAAPVDQQGGDDPRGQADEGTKRPELRDTAGLRILRRDRRIDDLDRCNRRRTVFRVLIAEGEFAQHSRPIKKHRVQAIDFKPQPIELYPL